MNNYTIKARYDNILGYSHAFLFNEEEATIDCEVRTINLPPLDVVLPPKYSTKIIAKYLDDCSRQDSHNMKSNFDIHATTKSLSVDIARPRSEIKQVFAKYVAQTNRLFKNEYNNKLVLVFTENDGECMTFAEAAEKYGDKKLYAEIHTNALYDRAQPIKLFVF